MCSVAVAHLSGGRCASDQLVCGYGNKKQHLPALGTRWPLMALSERCAWRLRAGELRRGRRERLISDHSRLVPAVLQ